MAAELLPEGALDDHGWDHERSNDTGNEGVTVERWYRHAALIVWPHSKHWEVACTSSIGKAIKVTHVVAVGSRDLVLDSTALVSDLHGFPKGRTLCHPHGS